MEPLSITAAVSSLLLQVAKNGKALAEIYGKYQGAQKCISAMQTECTVLRFALSQVKLKFPAKTKSALQKHPAGFKEVLDLSLAECDRILSALTKEIDKLTRGTSGEDIVVKKTKISRYLWNEASMNELRQQLRGQSSALGLLLQALHTSSLDQVLTILESGQSTFRQIAADAHQGQAFSTAEGEFIQSLDNIRSSLRAPALAVGVLSAAGSSIYVRGVRKYDCPTPVTQVDRFGIESLNYVMIPTLLAVLIEENLIRWSTTIAEALPALAEHIHVDHRGTTVEMLCARVSGLQYRRKDLESGDLANPIQHMSGVEGRKIVAMSVLADGARDRQETTRFYTRINLLVLAFILEERTSRSIEDLLGAKLLAPLKMYHTGAYGAEDTGLAASGEPTQPWGHNVAKGSTQIVPADPLEATRKCPPAYRFLFCLVSSLPDLMAFMNLHRRGALELQTPLLSAASFQKLHTTFRGTRVASNPMPGTTPGGWVKDGADGRYVVRVWCTGWSNSIIFNWAQKEGYIFVANMSSKKHGQSWKDGIGELEQLARNRSHRDSIPFSERPP